MVPVSIKMAVCAVFYTVYSKAGMLDVGQLFNARLWMTATHATGCERSALLAGICAKLLSEHARFKALALI